MDINTPSRILLASVVLSLVLVLASGFVTSGQSPNERYQQAAQNRPAAQSKAVAPRSSVTVVTVQRGDMRDLSGEIIAFRPNGTVLYHSDRYSSYWDVDPSPRGNRTITYVATEWLNASVCGRVAMFTDHGNCRRNVVERLNLTTGERTRLYSHRVRDGRWHDVDLINDTHLLVADIGGEAAFIVNISSGIREWMWTAESDLSVTSGGAYGKDWVHLNDVELLDDGRIMVDLRNQDRVAFLNRKSGIIENWTLGSEDNYEILREQHNPDYIPQSRGGPAVVVADSENNRIIEYQRVNGRWTRTWSWSDDRMQWARDADRLPIGHTLITDTIGDRVFEVNEQGEIVWRAPIDRAYEAERLGTGPESTGGPSAVRANLTSQRPTNKPDSLAHRFELAVRGWMPAQVSNGLLGYFFPWWMGFYDVLASLTLGGVLVVWIGMELRWSSGSLLSRLPLRTESLTRVRSILYLIALVVLGYAGTVVASLI